MQILATNGGAHPAEKIAVANAEQIMDSVFGTNRASSGILKLQVAIVDALISAHARLQQDERAALVLHGLDRLAHPLDPTNYVKAAVAKIAADAKGLAVSIEGDRWILVGDHFAKPEVQRELAALIGRFMVTSMGDERGWAIANGPAADEHRTKHLPGFAHAPDDPRVHAYHRAHADGTLVTAPTPVAA